jgi:hypothetical protein
MQVEFTAESVISEYLVWRDIRQYVPSVAFVAGVLLVGLILSWRVVALNVTWVVVMASLVAGKLINLPFANMMQSFSVIIALYIPVSLVSGTLARFARPLPGALKLPRAAVRSFMVVIVVLLGLWRMYNQMDIVDPSFIMVTRPDMRAMAWIRESVPKDARFLVEGFRIYNGTSVVGSDAGWWIPVMTSRSNTMPPQYALLSEQPMHPEYPKLLVRLVEELETAPVSKAAALCELGVTHVYLGQRRGTVGVNVEPLYRSEELLSSQLFTEVYAQDRVRIFEVDSRLCANGEASEVD